MAYTKQTWTTGEVITADKLNHMEDGIAAGGVYNVTSTQQGNGDLVLDKNYNEITAAMEDGKSVLVHNNIFGRSEIELVYGAFSSEVEYAVYTAQHDYTAETATDALVEAGMN